jgi:hypothetical protein
MASERPSATELSQALEGADFPKSKDDLVNYAKEHQQDTDVAGYIEQLPEGEYGSMADVEREFGKVA